MFKYTEPSLGVGTLLKDGKGRYIAVVQEGVYYRFIHLDNMTLTIGGDEMGTKEQLARALVRYGYVKVGHLDNFDLVER